nr:nuclear transport factor 2 family protein [Streptomyces sp. ISL-66]
MTDGLENTLVVLRAKLAGIAVVRAYEPDLPELTGYPGELNQVWTNLVDNAAAAMGGAGTLTLRARTEAEYDIATLHPVFVRQMDALAALDIEAVMKNYTDDAVLLRFEGASVGIEAVRETFTGYLTVKPTLVELQEYVETDDTIFYRAIMNLNGEPEHAFGTLVVRDGRIWRQTAGFGG